MELIIVGIKDNAVEVFQPAVHMVRARGEALRNFSDAINDPNNRQMHAHAEDFELWIIGTFDDKDGSIISRPERLARGQDVKRIVQ